MIWGRRLSKRTPKGPESKNIEGGESSPLFETLKLIIKLALRDIRNRQWASSGNGIDAFLLHVVSTVEAYDELRSHRDTLQLSSFPTVSRQIIASDPRLYISSRFPHYRLWEYQTGGTSGKPLAVYMDDASAYEWGFCWFERVVGMAPELKQHIKPFANLAERVHSGPRISFRSLLPRFNFAAQFHTNIGADPEWDISAARAIASRNARLLVGRPKVLLRLADILSELGQLANLTPWVILAAGDNLYLNDRLSIERAFRKRIYNAYASVEGGFIAMECAEHRAMHVFPEQCVVEVQDGDSLTSSGYGEIVITNLKNWAMPFIRYRTGDIGHIDIIECKCGRTGQVITRIDGRKSMLFDVDGTTLNPSFLNDALSYLPLKDIQIIKTDNNSFVVRVVPNSAANVADLCERIAHMVTEACSAREIQMQVVTSIGSLCEKTQRYVSGAT